MKKHFAKFTCMAGLWASAASLSNAAEIIVSEDTSWSALSPTPTASDIVRVDASETSVNLTQNSASAVAGGIHLWTGNATKSSGLVLTNGSMLDLGNGSIETYDLWGDLATPSSSAYSQIFLKNDNTGAAYKSSFFNAKSINVYNVNLATNSTGPVIWQINRPDAFYNVTGVLEMGGANAAATGSGVEHSAGTLKVANVRLGYSGTAMNLTYTLNGGTLITDNISTSGGNNTPSADLKASFIFDGGTIANYGGTTLNFSKKVWNSAETFNVYFGSKMETASTGISHSANVFQTAPGKSINLGGGVGIKELDGKAAGFTVKGGGTVTMWVVATSITGKVSILENSLIDVKQSSNGFKGDMYIEAGSTYNIIAGTNLFYVWANKTFSGGGKVLIAKDFRVHGKIDPMGADAGIGTFSFVSSEVGTMYLSQSAIMEIDILADFSNFDKIDIGGNTFAAEVAGAGLGKIIFDIAKGAASGTHKISAGDIFKQGGTTDWSLAKLESLNSDWLVAYENGNFVFTAVPEPATIAGLFAIAALGFAILRRRK